MKIAEEIGQAVHHSTRMIILDTQASSPSEGSVVEYYGGFAGVFWPHWYEIRDAVLLGEPVVAMEERLAMLDQDHLADYFVVLDVEEFLSQTELREFLAANFETTVEHDDYIIFDLRTRK